MSGPVRVRFAPSPTGHLHIGGARTALFNFLFARGTGGVFVLRIEDTDVERSTDESTRVILQDLKWLGLSWDEGPEAGGAAGPYFQSQRLDLYRRRAQDLLGGGHAYPCFCSAELLDRKRQEAQAAGATPKYDGTCRALTAAEAGRRVAAGEPHVVRLKLPAEGTTAWEDLIRGRVAFENAVLDDLVLVRSNGMPTYNFAVTVDDAAMRITHIIRGDDHISNTPRQIHIYQALGEPLPAFAHVPMILGADKSRLSKRHGATSVGAYEEQGYLPEALVNYLVLLGWAYDDKTTLFSRDELVEKFTLNKVSKNPAVFDPAKLLWMNGVYIRQLPPEEFIARSRPFLVRAGLLAEDAGDETRAWAGRVALAVRDNLKTLAELPDAVRFFFETEPVLEEKARAKLELAKARPELFLALLARLRMLESFTPEALEALFQAFVEENHVKFGEVVHPLRAAVTGRVSSPGIFAVLDLLGKERTLRRLEAGLKHVGVL
jgi:glutamyl-tRNA synthetase